MAKEYKACQSCGTPFDKLPSPEGKSDNEMYCTMCWKDGAFVHPDVTLEEMEKGVFEQIQKHTNYPAFIIKKHIKSIKKLERWK